MKLPVRRIAGVSPATLEKSPPPPDPGGPAPPFEALYRSLMPRVFGYVATLLRDPSSAEDVTALAFERAYRRRRSFRLSRGTAEAWVFGIARNAALDELRRRRRHATLAVDPEDLSRAASYEQTEATLRRETVRAALGALEPRERDLVGLKFAGGLSNVEIAQVLGVSESSAGSRLHRVVDKLREECRDEL